MVTGIDGTGMRRRTLCRLLASGGLAAASPGCLSFAGAENRDDAPVATSVRCDAETYPGIEVRVAVTALQRGEDAWRADCRVRLDVRYGNDDVALTDARLVGTDASGTVLGTTSLGDLRWTGVPADRRYAISTCEGEYAGGRLDRSGRLVVDELPRWITVRFRRQGFGKLSVTAREYAADETTDAVSPEDFVARPAADGPLRTVLTETPWETEPGSSTDAATSTGETSTDATATASSPATRSDRK